MGTDRRRAIAVAVGVVLVLLVGVVALVAGGDDDVSTAERASADDPSTSGTDDDDDGSPSGSEGPSDTTGVDANAGDDGSSPASAPTTSAAPSATTPGDQPPPADLGAAQDPGPTRPPGPGTYRYRYEAEGSAAPDGSTDGDGDGESTTTITDVSRQGDVVRQTVDMRGGQFDATSTVEWRPDRVLVARSVFRFGGQEADCDWEPDYLQAVFPLREGATWEGRSSCTISGFGVPVTVERTTTNRVVGLERREIAGRVLDLWVIDSDDRISFSTNEVRSQVRSWFSPPLGLVAAAEGTFEGDDGTGSGEGRFSTELLQLPSRAG